MRFSAGTVIVNITDFRFDKAASGVQNGIEGVDMDLVESSRGFSIAFTKSAYFIMCASFDIGTEQLRRINNN